MEEKKEELRKKKVKKAVVAGVTSASVLLGGTFDTPEDILNPAKKQIKPVSEVVDHSDDLFEDLYKKEDPKDAFKNLIYKIPLKIRMYVCVPLWFLGTGILTLLELLLKVVLVPLAHIILNFILHTVLLMAIIAICVKLLFPDLPWSKIFNKRTLLFIFIGSIIMSLLDVFMPIVWDKYRLYRMLSKLIIGLIVLFTILRPFIKKKLDDMYEYEITYNGKTLA